ncbi:response regulator transcription factor [Natronoglycomyces albus]|uniref:Response regulator transcription factor n=1 Tax=Natronoglycomyces albus TaxID=2811108 RepID=A0A895XVA1_9ACTN|nr:response regulator transcription factor [Natronoglycomyces albus]QSB05568.1 response regulator transcription factor [Natronoglycomyces albus]
MRLVIAEDSVLLRTGLIRLLSDAGIDVVGEADDAASLLRHVAELNPDLAIVDVRMPPTYTDEGIRAAIEIRRRFPATAVLVLSQYVEEEYATELISQNTHRVGYLLKDRVADVGDFVDAVNRVNDGGTALDPEVISQLLVRSHRKDPLDRLTPRERDVLALMAEGRSNAGIARVLTLSDGAVEKHIGNILNKLDLPSATGDNRRVLAVLRFLES